MSTDLVLLGTAGGPMPARGRAGIASALVVDGRVFLVDCGRGVSTRYLDCGLDFPALEAILLTHLHADHTADLPGMLLYPWGARVGDDGALSPVHVYGPDSPAALPDSPDFPRPTIIEPAHPTPGTTELVDTILAAFAYHLNVMPVDAAMPDAGQLVRSSSVKAWGEGSPMDPVVVFADDEVTVTAVEVSHGHSHPALAYRFDTAAGSVVFSGDTTVSENLVRLATGADILVHEVIDLAYLEEKGTTGTALEHLAALHTDVNDIGTVAERAGVSRLVLTHFLPPAADAIPDELWRRRASEGFSGEVVVGSDGLRISLGG